MSANKDQPHVLVLPEDDANREIIAGFERHHGLKWTRRIQRMPAAGGGKVVLDLFEQEYVPRMTRNLNTHMVLLIDFDGHYPQRIEEAKARIPEQLADRVFILGARTEPEDLKTGLGLDYDAIGLRLANDCFEGTNETWAHDHLRHNASEVERLRQAVRDFLFEPA